MLTDILLIALFILIGGVFASAEMALVSLRDSQIKQLATRGKRGATVARLAQDPNTFLSAVQIGVTVSGFLSASFGGATIAGALSGQLIAWGVPTGLADVGSLVLVTVIISYFSIVFSELTAKRLAMQRAESFAMALAPLVNAIAVGLRPVIWFLSASTDLVVRLLGGDPKAARDEVTPEELRAMVTSADSISVAERRIVDDVFDAAQQSLREVMVPRTEVDFLPAEMPLYKAVREIRDAPHSRYPVTRDSADDLAGFVHIRDLLQPGVAGTAIPVIELARPLLFLPETMKVLSALSEMQRASTHLAIVRDEYGGTAGIVTVEDLVEELVGEITDEYDEVQPSGPAQAHRKELDGLTSLEDFEDLTGYLLPEGPYDTLAGFFMAQEGRLPAVGDELTVDLAAATDGQPEGRFDLRVLELDGRRAARFLMQRTSTDADRSD
ncbi:hemolysin family protein [Granulicoccus phenolivorans]|uniref:hemolysin family protein n=1 Tax=Granulicoccus phenolivorans TaxID=266854 RepID=UPI00040DF966|nr:hemolysin family protein [Granulicoccus phenolivorans]